MDGIGARCGWVTADPLYLDYHDREWGVPERDGARLWGQMVLESFQSGLSWLTILRKREGFRARFEGLDPARVARWGEAEVAAALADPGIVRHRGKVEATVANARAWVEMGGADAFAALVWDVVDGVPVQRAPATLADVPARTAEGDALARALKGRGVRFVGPTTAYAFMQAAGLTNDHVVPCPRCAEVAALSPRAGP